ncbi:MAG: hypothetical protein ACOC16_01500 [Nanoarchaeota archaeon]
MKNKNKFNQKIITILTITLLLLIAGCNNDNNTDNKTSGLFGEGTSSKGGSGVSLSFAKGNPPEKIIKGQTVTFAFVFTNYQEHPITDLQVKTKNFDRGYVTGLGENYNINEIPRASSKTGPGIYSGNVVEGVKIDSFNGNYNFNPIFDYCYSAKTFYREQICVPSNKNQCDTNIEKSSKQNGPIDVKIERMTSVNNNVRIDFIASNTGSGQVVNECFKTDDYANDYDLKVTLGSSEGTCEATSGQKIINGKSNFYCTFPRTGDDSYASQVIVEMDYKYQQTSKHNIMVEDLNQGYE